jgi:anti-sigma factor RsiW
MACELWRDKLDAYADGELAVADAAALGAHLRGCASCSADVLERVQLKRSIAAAGKNYAASAQLREKVRRSVAVSPPRERWRWWNLVAAPAALVLVVLLAVTFYSDRGKARQERVYSELADLHVATLASVSPVDVVSTDRHTVKPWFEGKIPFAFNLPELAGTDFTLVGGRVAYLEQSPGAQLIYRIRKHEISVFIFQDRGGDLGRGDSALSFSMESWSRNGLRYFVVGDVGRGDLESLRKLLRDAG